MRQRDDSVFLRHIRDAILLVEQYLQGVGPKKFKESTLLQDGAIRQIQIIGEAADLPELKIQIAALLKTTLS